ncbi:hypothetical protein KIH31_02860 [Paenarthrobacter sp. DKR-5]|uniref:hypothetical protein n=1 Tax=Paenarthrobacter sp. DKR-5 TaxID=2835535 RepID=UPI001BDCCF71|nr:hypothetical protein [Paenarthrobacter sp. DKR-5]MBT1001533.1 hypothetical protein [Paenarthrobacter sp. DKR-5]
MSENQHSPLHRGEGPADGASPAEPAPTEAIRSENVREDAARSESPRTEALRRDTAAEPGNETRVIRRQVPAEGVGAENAAGGGSTIRGERSGRAAGAHSPAPYAGDAAPVLDRETFNARAKERFGGVKAGSAFFGWVTAMGMAVLLTALAAAAGMAVSLSTNTSINQAATGSNAGSVGITGAIVLAVILFVAYYCGGYVAGRMARFNGLRQGLAVWLWALVVAVLVAILGASLGSRFNVLANLNSFPRIPVNEGDVTTVGIVAIVIAAVVALVGAILGGLAGMRFHRRADRAGFEDRYDEDGYEERA